MKHAIVGAVAGAALLVMPTAGAKIEIDYSKPWCAAHHGEAEVVMPNGTRADCITVYYAIEMDRAAHFRQAIGQSLEYASQAGLQPGIVLIMGPKDKRYLRRLHEIIRRFGLPIQVWTTPEDAP